MLIIRRTLQSWPYNADIADQLHAVLYTPACSTVLLTLPPEAPFISCWWSRDSCWPCVVVVPLMCEQPTSPHCVQLIHRLADELVWGTTTRCRIFNSSLWDEKSIQFATRVNDVDMRVMNLYVSLSPSVCPSVWWPSRVLTRISQSVTWHRRSACIGRPRIYI